MRAVRLPAPRTDGREICYARIREQLLRHRPAPLPYTFVTFHSSMSLTPAVTALARVMMALPDAASAEEHRRVVPIPRSTNWRIRQTAAGGPASPRVCIMASPLPPVRQPGRARGAGRRGREGPRRRPPAELEAGGDTRREVIEGPTHALDRPASQLPEPRGTSPTNRRTARRTTCRSTFARFMPTQIAEKSPTSLQRWSGPSTGGWCR